MTAFREAFTEARARIRRGEDPELVVPGVLALAEAQEEIEQAERLYGDLPQPDEDDR